MTCIATGKGWLYLAAILDLFSHKPDAERQSEIVGWAMSETMPQALTLAALNMAITNRKPGPGLLHQSDRGSHYAANAYRRVLDEHGIRCSMSCKGNCWDNAPMESFFGSLKTELDGDGPRHQAGSAHGSVPGHRGLAQPPAPTFEPRLHHAC